MLSKAACWLATHSPDFTLAQWSQTEFFCTEDTDYDKTQL